MPDKVCELVSLTHQRGDTLVSDNVSWWLATLEVLARPPAWRQCRLSAVSAGLTLAQRWTGHPVTALSALAVSAASARRRPTSMLCNIQHMTGDPEVGGLWGVGGGVARTRWSLNQHSKTPSTGILANLPAGLQPDVTYYMLVGIKFIRSACRHFRHCGEPCLPLLPLMIRY